MTALGLQTPQHIIKRDGHLADFDPQKIWSAIYRCMISGHESAEVSGEAATTVTERVLRELAVLEESPSVEEVQDLVEKTLWHSGYQAGALAYIRYREMRRLLREEKSPKRARKKKAAEPGATFRLEESFVQKYRKIPPPWGFGVLSELTFLRTYARPKPDGTLERWFETIRRVVEGTYRMQERHIKAQNLGWNEKRAQKSAQEMYERMFWMKFLPPGRGLWAMGSVLTEERALFAALNNCFAHETEIITDQGVRAIGDLAGSEPVLLTTNGQWVSAPIRSFGKQQLYKISLIRQGIEKEIYATAEHRWFAKSQPMVNQSKGYAEFLTRELQPGYRLQYNFGKGISSVRPSPFGIAHGIAYGDATTAGNPCLYLCGEKNASLAHWFPNNPKTLDASKQAVRVADLPRFFRRLPDINESKSYLYGWLAGYFAADGSCKANGQCIISSYDRKNIEFARDVCVRLGIGTWSISSEERVSNLTGEKRISYSMGLMKDTLTEDFLLLPEHLENFRAANHDAAKRYWNVVSVEETDRYEQVYCATVEDKGAFTLADNILTGNCGFASTEEIDTDPFAPFLFLMDMSMLGVGVGFDTFGTGKIRIVSPGTADTLTGRWKKYYPLLSNREETVDWEGKPVVFDYEPRDGVFVIPDTREGWVVSALYILDAFFTGASLPRFDCSQVRPAGLVIKGFGGLTSGPGPLIEMHRRLIAFLTQYIGGLIDSEVITTLMNLKGKCVVSGNVRRTAEIAFGLPEDRGFLALKDYRYNAETGEYEGPRADRAEFGYTSNNSVFATLGMDYRECADRTRVNGEPGYAWLENMRAYGRMVDPPDHRDKRVKGGNPCLEQSLESWELCCLVETFIARHESLEDYRRTLKFAYLYAKTVTLGKTHWAETNKVMLRNRRIGCSMSGVQQFVAREGLDTLRKWCEAGYKTICDWDRVYSEWLCVPESIKKTSIKPSGTVSLLAGATPGMHWPENVCYLRRINVPGGSPLLPPLEQAGYPIEPNVNDPTSMIVAIPVKLDVPVRPVHQVSIWEQVAMAAFLQRYWADNQVSCLTAETLIHTNRGLVRIGDLHSHLEMSRAHFGAQPYNGPVQVLDEGGEWKPISHLIINPPSPIIKVQMEGGQCLRGTLDHKVRVLGESLTLEWKTLSSIRPGDYLLEKLGRSSYGSAGQLLEQRLEVFRREVKTCGHKEARVPGQVTSELGEFLGYMVSDGHLGHTNAAFGLTQQNNNVVPRFQELVRGLFNLDTHICEDLRSPGLLQVGRSSVLVNDWLRFVGLYDEENKKRVPWPIMAAGERTIKAFLRGITLDGHVCKESGRVVVTTTNSYRLAEEVCELLKVVGFQPSIFQSGPGGERTFPHGQTYQSGPCWNVSLSADQSCRFVRMIGFAEERKTQEYQEFGDKQRRSLFGGVPDFGLREKMSDVALRCTSRFLKDHFHSASLHAGKEVSRESLLQLFDMGEDVPDHLLDQKNAYRRVIAVAVQPAEVTFDLTVPESHSYLSNGFVSHNCTVTFDPETEGDQIERVLEHFQYSLKGISLLPKLEAGAYAQMPYEEISEERYQQLAAGLKPVQLTQIDDSERELEQFCDGNACLLPAR